MTILLLDDDVLLLRATTRLLRSKGHTVVPCCTVDQAVEVCRNYGGDIDVLLSDVDLDGGVGGAATAGAICHLCPHVRAIFMSAHSRETLVAEGRLAPDAVFLDKPMSLHALSRALGG